MSEDSTGSPSPTWPSTPGEGDAPSHFHNSWVNKACSPGWETVSNPVEIRVVLGSDWLPYQVGRKTWRQEWERSSDIGEKSNRSPTTEVLFFLTFGFVLGLVFSHSTWFTLRFLFMHPLFTVLLSTTETHRTGPKDRVLRWGWNFTWRVVGVCRPLFVARCRDPSLRSSLTAR